MIRFALLLSLLTMTLWWSAAAQSRVDHDILEAVIRNELEPSTLLPIGSHKRRCISIKSRATAEDEDPDAQLIARFSADRPPAYPASTCAKDSEKASTTDFPLLMWLTAPVFLAEDEAEVRIGYYHALGIDQSGYTIMLRRQGERWKVVARIKNYPNVIAG
jgi:hypothetical protein